MVEERKCPVCSGSKRCGFCKGTGKVEGRECQICDGTGECRSCRKGSIGW